MKESQTKITTVITIILLIFFLSFINKTNNEFVEADFYVPAIFNAGGILLDTENLSLVLEDAEVVYDIAYSIEDFTGSNYVNKDAHLLKYNFSGEYVISNSNETVNVLVGLPLTDWFFDRDIENFIIQANGSSITGYTVFEVLYSFNQTLIDIVEKSLNDSINNIRLDISTFLFFDLTFEAHSNTILSYSYSCQYKRGPYGDCEILYYISEVRVNYFIGTAKTWKHNITETIQMTVDGTQPDNWTKPCLVTQNNNDTDYLWSWEDEPVTQDIVGIVYEFEELECKKTTSTPAILSSLFLYLVIVITLRKRKNSG